MNYYNKINKNLNNENLSKCDFIKDKNSKLSEGKINEDNLDEKIKKLEHNNFTK